MRHYQLFSGPLSFAVAMALFFACTGLSAAQEPAPPPAAAQSTKAPAEKQPELPAQIQLLETHVRFEANGDSSKEVHTLVHINNELGARQFARLNFDYNRSFQQIELPLMRITHASGGTADILPGAVSDQPNPAVVNFPAYQDVRVKSVRILGLEPGDTLEYRVVTTTTHHPLAPDFWLDHTFDRSGVVSHEFFDLDLPTARSPEIRINPATPAASTNTSPDGETSRTTYRWERKQTPSAASESKAIPDSDPDLIVSTEGWERLSVRLDEKLTPAAKPLEKTEGLEESQKEASRKRFVTPEVTAKAVALTKALQSDRARLHAIYDFVSQEIHTVDLPLGATGFAARPANDILQSGYATAEDKFVLFAGLAEALRLNAVAALTGYCDENGVARPSVFRHLLVSAGDGKESFWLDPALEVAPFGLIPPSSGKCVFVLNRRFLTVGSTAHEWQPLHARPPFASSQRVNVDAALAADGNLAAKVRYSMRGDNELLLRVAFHQAPKEKWKEVAQLLALSDGFRGKVTNVIASDPYATKEPFTVEYEITQPKFVDWSKKPVRIPAILPLVALPEAANSNGNSTSGGIELGTPLDVQTRVTLRVPPDTSIRAPAGTSVDREYATFSSEYSARSLTLTAERHINFLRREIPAAHAADYAAFVHAVQNDQAQEFTLERAGSASAAQTVDSKITTPAAAAKP